MTASDPLPVPALPLPAPRHEPGGGFWRRSLSLNALYATESVLGFLTTFALVRGFGLSERLDVLFAAWMTPTLLGRGIFSFFGSRSLGYVLIDEDREGRRTRSGDVLTVAMVSGLLVTSGLLATRVHWLGWSLQTADATTMAEALIHADLLVWVSGLAAASEGLRVALYGSGWIWSPTVVRVAGAATTLALVLAGIHRDETTLAAVGILVGAALEAVGGVFLSLRARSFRLRPTSRLARPLATVSYVALLPCLRIGVDYPCRLVEIALASRLGPGGVTVVETIKRVLYGIERFVFGGFFTVTVLKGPAAPARDLAAAHRLTSMVGLLGGAILLAAPWEASRLLVHTSPTGSSPHGLLATMLAYLGLGVAATGLWRVPAAVCVSHRLAALDLGLSVLQASVHVATALLLAQAGTGVHALGLALVAASMAGGLVCLTAARRVAGPLAFPIPELARLVGTFPLLVLFGVGIRTVCAALGAGWLATLVLTGLALAGVLPAVAHRMGLGPLRGDPTERIGPALEVWTLERFGLTPAKLWVRLAGDRHRLPRILCVSVPEAGTHLLERALCLHPRLYRRLLPTLHPGNLATWGGLDRILAALPPGELVFGHLPFEESLPDRIRAKGVQAVFLHRDPRGVLVSMAAYLVRSPEQPFHQEFLDLPDEASRLRLLLTGDPAIGLHPFRATIESFLGWLDSGVPAFRACDLVGTAGGGSHERQSRELARLFEAVRLPLDEDELATIARRTLSSRSPGFHQDDVDAWRGSLGPELMAECDKLFGDLIDRAGYSRAC